MNEIQADIKLLEEIFKKYDKSYIMPIKTTAADDLHIEHLGWIPSSKQKTKRLCYFLAIKDEICTIDNINTTVELITPLVETKVKIRRAVTPLLSEFLQRYVDNIKLNGIDNLS